MKRVSLAGLAWLFVWVAVCSFAGAAAAQPWRPMSGEIAGTLLAPDGAPLAGARVRLSGERNAEASSTLNGRFRFTSLSPGVYTVEVQSDGRVSSWAEEIAVDEGQILRLEFVLAEGKETSVTVSTAPILDSSPAGPVWRLNRGQLAPLPYGGGAHAWVRLAALRTETAGRRVLIDGFAPSPSSFLAPEWIEEVASYSGAAPAPSAGSVRGEEIVLLTHRPAKEWSGRAEIGHQSRDLEGRDRTLTTAVPSGPVQVLVDQDRTLDRGSLMVGGGVTQNFRLTLSHVSNKENERRRVGSCSDCEPHGGVLQRESRDLSRLSGHWMRARWQLQGSFSILDAEARTGGLGTSLTSGGSLGGDVNDQRRWLIRSELEMGRSLRGHVSLASRDSRRNLQGFWPGSSGRVFLAGVGGVPLRSAGGEDLVSSGSEDEAESPRSGLAFLEASGPGLGSHRIRFGLASERSDHVRRERRTQDFVLWGVAPALGGQLASAGHVLVETTAIDLEGRTRTEALFVEDLLQVGRLSARGGVRLQRSDWRSQRDSGTCADCRLDLSDELLPRLALAFDPRGLGQERLTLEVGRYAGGTAALVPLLGAASGAMNVRGLPLSDAGLAALDRSLNLFDGTSGGLKVAEEYDASRSIQASLGAEHLLLPGLMVSGSLTARRYERSPGVRTLADGTLGIGDRGARSPDFPCRRGETELRLRGGWRGSAGGLEAQADVVRAHGTRSADCLDAVGLPGLQRSSSLGSNTSLGSNLSFGRLRMFGHKDLSERWTLAVAAQFLDRAGAELGWRQTIEGGQWLERASSLETSDSSTWNVDLAVRHRSPISGADGLALVATLEVLNLFDARSVESSFNGLLLSPDVEGSVGAADPRAGLPFAFQEARAVRLGFGVTF